MNSAPLFHNLPSVRWPLGLGWISAACWVKYRESRRSFKDLPLLSSSKISIWAFQTGISDSNPYPEQFTEAWWTLKMSWKWTSKTNQKPVRWSDKQLSVCLSVCSCFGRRGWKVCGHQTSQSRSCVPWTCPKDCRVGLQQQLESSPSACLDLWPISWSRSLIGQVSVQMRVTTPCCRPSPALCTWAQLRLRDRRL